MRSCLHLSLLRSPRHLLFTMFKRRYPRAESPAGFLTGVFLYLRRLVLDAPLLWPTVLHWASVLLMTRTTTAFAWDSRSYHREPTFCVARRRPVRSIVGRLYAHERDGGEGGDTDPLGSRPSTRTTPPIGTQGFGIRFLGKGSQATVRPGVILVAPQHEFHHFYRHAAIFVHAMGIDDRYSREGEQDYVIRGVILDHPTPFTLGEMMFSPNSTESTDPTTDTSNPLYRNFLFRGGDKGGDGVMILHKYGFGQAVRNADEMEAGVPSFSHGGWDAALDLAETSSTSVSDDFKFFFNYCEFTERELEQMFDDEEDGDGWMSVEALDPELVLSSDWDRGELWRRLRNAVSQMGDFN